MRDSGPGETFFALGMSKEVDLLRAPIAVIDGDGDSLLVRHARSRRGTDRFSGSIGLFSTVTYLLVLYNASTESTATRIGDLLERQHSSIHGHMYRSTWKG